MEDDDLIPSVFESGSDGSQKEATHGEIITDVTRSELHGSELLGAMAEISSTRPTGFSGPALSSLILAHGQDVERENHELKLKNTTLQDRLDGLNEKYHDLDKRYEIARQKNSNSRLLSWMSAGLSVFGGILISLAFLPSAEILDDRDYSILFVAGIVYVVSLIITFAPFGKDRK